MDENKQLTAMKNENDCEVVITARFDLKVLFEKLYKENLEKKPRNRNKKIIESLEEYKGS